MAGLGTEPRVLAWFSCGAASAVAAKFATQKYGNRCNVVYCDTSNDEHPDNLRFLADIESWVDQPIVRLKSERYASVDSVVAKTRYMAGVNGARCTVELKKVPRFAYQHVDDIHIFGFTADESKRITRFETQNPELETDWILLEANISKAMCFEMLESAGIELPALYHFGYKNNNCLGCVKATSARYWNMVRRDFPDVFAKRAEQSRELNVRLTRFKGKRIFLDELPQNYLGADPLEDISCGPDCNN